MGHIDDIIKIKYLAKKIYLKNKKNIYSPFYFWIKNLFN